MENAITIEICCSLFLDCGRTVEDFRGDDNVVQKIEKFANDVD